MRSDGLDASNRPATPGRPQASPPSYTDGHSGRKGENQIVQGTEHSGNVNNARPRKIRFQKGVHPDAQADFATNLPSTRTGTRPPQPPLHISLSLQQQQASIENRPVDLAIESRAKQASTRLAHLQQERLASAGNQKEKHSRSKRERALVSRGEQAPTRFFKKYRVFLVISCLVLCAGSQAFLLLKDGIISSLAGHTPGQAQNVLVNGGTRASGQQGPTKLPSFETGIIYPQWTPDGYGPIDTKWQQGLSDIQAQTGAKWLEMTVIFAQPSLTSKQITTYGSTPSVDSFAAGVRTARAHGYHVFVVPLMHVGGAIESWVGSVQFSSYQDQQQWFDAYWQVYQPYVIAAAQAGADQISIGTEIEWLQQNAAASLWNTLIARVRHVFSGFITYDMNWSSLNKPLPTWMKNSQLTFIGISEYLPMEDKQVRVDPKEIFNLWKTIVKPAFDNVSIHLGKPVLISEIGYRDTADALYLAWHPYSPGSPKDPQEQAAAYDAALGNAIPDPHIAGMFFWGWDEVGDFKLAGQPAVTVLHSWYTRA